MTHLKFRNLKFISCSSCYKEKVIPGTLDGAPNGLILFELYRDGGWMFSGGLWYCAECRPKELAIDPNRHPHYTDYMDSWGTRDPKEYRSHYFEKETYDPYAKLIKYDMCDCCEYMKYGYEYDGSNWQMCRVDDPKDSYGHNLYSGHFYGAAIDGRLCPYFTCRHHRGRDPEKDKKDGTFHVPYDERYDGD